MKTIKIIFLLGFLSVVSWAQFVTGISATSPTSTSEVVSWTTNAAATTVVNYGATTGYGSTASSGTLVTSHSITISPLTSGATYHYQIQSVDSAGNTVSVPDATFTVMIGYSLSFSTSSNRSGGAYLQGATLSGTSNYIFTSLSTSATTFNVTGATKSCFWLDNTAMSGTATSCDYAVPFDFANTASAVTFKQVNAATPQSNVSSVPIVYTAAQTSGDLNVVIVGWNNTTSTVTSVTDTSNNTYTLAIGPTTGTGLRQSIYYAKNINSAGAGANTVTVVFNTSTPIVDVRILEYAGLDTTAPFDLAAGASGTSTTANSGNTITTTQGAELLVGGGMTNHSFTSPGTGYTSRIITAPDADIAEDRTVNVTGTYNATGNLNTSANWVMQVATFKAAMVVAPWSTTGVSNATHTITQAVTRTTGGTDVSTASFTVNNTVHSVTLSWTQGTAVNPVTYSVYRSTTSGSLYTRIATGLTALTYKDLNVISGTTYYYVVTETDTVTGLQSANSNQVTAAIP